MSAIVVLRIFQTLFAAAVATLSFITSAFYLSWWAPVDPVFGAYGALAVACCLSGLAHLFGVCGRPKSRGTMKFYIFSDVFFGLAVLVTAAMEAYLAEGGWCKSVSNGWNSDGSFFAWCNLLRIMYILGILLVTI